MAVNEARATRAVRILVVAPLPPPSGGIGRWTQLLIRWAIDRKDVQIRIVDIAPRFKRGFDKRMGIRLLAGLIQGPWDLARIFWLLLSFEPDVMHLTTSGGLAGVRDYFAISLAKIFKVRSFYHLHFGTLPEKIRGQAAEWRLLRWPIRRADVILTVDEQTALVIQNSMKGHRAVFLPNVINVSAPEELPGVPGYGIFNFKSLDVRPKRRVLYIGWILETKGLRELVNAWGRICTTGWDLIIVGPGPIAFRRELYSITRGNPSIKIYDEVTQAEAWRWMLSADIFVLPTYTEGFPNVVLEAMAASKPIIATPVGAIPEILNFASSNPCGIMVPVRDAETLAIKLAGLMGDPVLRQRLGNFARKRAEDHYDVPVVFSRLLKMWKESAGLRSNPRIQTI